MIVFSAHGKKNGVWLPLAGGRFEVGEAGDGSEAAAQTAAVRRALAAQAAGFYQEFKVLRVETSAVWPQSEHRVAEVQVRQLEWHEGHHAWNRHDGYPRHQHSLNGALTIAPNDTRLHFKHSTIPFEG